MNRIPSDEEFDRVSKMMDKQFLNLDAVKKNVIEYFMNSCPLHDFHILPQGDDGFRAYLFVKKDADIEACKRSGVLEDVKAYVREELERAGHGKKEEITVALEVDSDENVSANFEGDYFLRLR